MGGTVSRSDFVWTKEIQPHISRRKQILGKTFSLIFLSILLNSYSYYITENFILVILGFQRESVSKLMKGITRIFAV